MKIKIAWLVTMVLISALSGSAQRGEPARQDQDGKFIRQYTQFSRPSGIAIDKNDVMYVSDSESESVSRNHYGWKRGIRIGRIKDGKVTAFIPDPVDKADTTSAAEGIAIDSKGAIYGAEVVPNDLKKYVRRELRE